MKGRRRRVVSERAWRAVYKIEAYTEQDGLCQYCRTSYPLKQMTADHKRAIKLYGQTTAANIKAACSPCNRAKGHLTPAQFMRAIHEPDFKTDPWPLYMACLEIRLRLATAAACRRLLRIIQ